MAGSEKGIKKLAQLAKVTGSQLELAEKTKVLPQNLNAWICGRRPMSLKNARIFLDYAHSIGFDLKLKDLRPDLHWLEVVRNKQ